MTEEAWQESIETKLVQALDESRKGDIMTIAEKLRAEGRIEGKIKGKIETYQDLSDKGLLPKELAEREIAKLRKKLEKLNRLEKAA